MCPENVFGYFSLIINLLMVSLLKFSIINFPAFLDLIQILADCLIL